MRIILPSILSATLVASIAIAQNHTPKDAPKTDAGKVTSHSQGLHGYIGFGHETLPPQGGYSAGMGFYAAVWPLVDQPLADFQIGLPSSWVTPENSDTKTNRSRPKARWPGPGRNAAPLGAPINQDL